MEKSIAFELPQFEVARVKALEFTRATGLEYGIVLDPQKGIYKEVAGHPGDGSDCLGYVDFSEIVEEHEVKGKWILHSHPNDGPFSIQDIKAASSGGVAGGIVIGREGSVYAVRGVNHHRLNPFLLYSAQNWARNYAYTTVHTGVLTPDEAEVVVGHLLNQKLADAAGYEYTYELSDHAKAALWKLDHKLEELRANGY